MRLSDLFNSDHEAVAHFDGKYKIPWDEPGFSARMLKEHLNQDHDWASRPWAQIDRHVAWIHGVMLGGQKARILDIGCGPGFYASRLTALGHAVYGIDFSPASIAYAKEHNEHPDRCEYVLGDIREAEFGGGYDLAMMVYGEFNAFPTPEIESLLAKTHAVLKPGGQLLLEPNLFAAVKRFGSAPNSWYAAPSGLFSDRPHVCLISNDWNEETESAQSRFVVIDNETGGADHYFSTTQAYSNDRYRELLGDFGFTEIEILPDFGQENFGAEDNLMLIRARKG